MEKNFILDEEVNLKEYDFLKTNIYAENLTKIINNSQSNKVFTIGLFGKWGTGKSSIIKTSQRDFDENKVKFITYDTWQYANDSFRRMFLRKLREDLHYNESDSMKRFYVSESNDIDYKYQLSSSSLVIIIVSLIILILVLAYIPFTIDYKLPIYAVFTLLGVLVSVVSGSFNHLKISVTKPPLFAPEQFEECFKEIVSHSLASLSHSDKLLKWVKADSSIHNLHKLVIVLDNIDRCNSEVAYNLLTDVKTFMCSEPLSIIFVIPVDDEALKNHIINTHKNLDCEREKEEFLRKFFNVTIRIKQYGTIDMYSFAKSISEKHGLGFNQDTISLASKEYARNPRRIIQLFNSLLAEFNYYDSMFIRKNEALICCLLIIREEYSEYYAQLVNSPKLFNDVYLGKDEDVRRFIRIAQYLLGKVNICDLGLVITNTHSQFDFISKDIKEAVDTFDIEKLLDTWERDNNSLVDYICYRLDFSVKNLLIETDLVCYFDLVCNLNTNKRIPVDLAKRIDEKILNNIESIIYKTKSHNNLCEYALLRSEHEDGRLKDALVEGCKRDKNEAKGEYWTNLFRSVLLLFQDRTTSLLLASTYLYYFKDIEFDKLSEDQIEFLLSDEFVNNMILEIDMKSGDLSVLDKNNTAYDFLIKILKKKKNISVSSYNYLFDRFVNIYNSLTLIQEIRFKDITALLCFVNPLLSLIPSRILESQPKSLYSLIIDDREVYNNIPLSRTSGNQISFISTCIREKIHLREIFDFIFNIYRITNNKTDISSSIKKLIQSDTIYDELVKWIDNGFSLAPFINIIFNQTDRFDYKNWLIILEHCFVHISNMKDQSILISKIENKIDLLIDYVQYNTVSNDVLNLLVVLANQDTYKSIIAELIRKRSFAFVNSLPVRLFNLVIDVFDISSFMNFSNNFEILSTVLENGTDIQKKLVVNILITKLDNNEDISNVLDLIEYMRNNSMFDEDGLLHTHLASMQRRLGSTLNDADYIKIQNLL